MIRKRLNNYLVLFFLFSSFYIFGQSVAVVEDSPVSCFGENDGVATATATGGTAPYTYTWDRSTSTSNNPIDLPGGNNIVTVIDAVGEVFSNAVVINEPAPLIATAIQDKGASCFGLSDGAATVTVTGGTSPYTYSWDKSASSTAIATDLAAGNHAITIRDANNCETKAYVTISQPTKLLAEASELKPVNCFGENNGEASVTVNGGTSPYTFSWDNSPSTAAIASDLIAGIHTVTITDVNNCVTTAQVTITEPAELTASVVVNSNVKCLGGNNGVATVTAIGGTAPYTYNWDNGETTAKALNLDAGVHTILITDANNCTTTELVTITEPILALSATASQDTEVLCNGGNTGVATVNVSGGTAPYTFTWDNGATTATVSNLTAGSHQVTVIDANNCSITTSVTITEPSALTATVTKINDATCHGLFDGAAEVTVTGGTFPYSFNWDKSSSNSSSATDLGAGIQKIIITDANGCINEAFVTILEPATLTASIMSTTNPVCFDDPQGGTLTFEVLGGSIPYSYSIDGGPPVLTSNSITPISNLTNGNHTIVITDANNCNPVALNQTITIPSQITFDASTVVVNPICSGSGNGSITLDVGGLTVTGGTEMTGTQRYKYTWTYPSGAVNTVKNLTNLQDSGQYLLVVTDAGGCVSSNFTVDVILKTLQITNSSPATQNISCNGDNDASIFITAESVPVSTFNIKWFVDGVYNASFDGASTISNLGPGTYRVEVSDLNDASCVINSVFEITEPPIFNATISSVNPNCFTDPLGGKVSINFTGGTAPYQYRIDGGGWLTAPGSIVEITGLTAGNHTFEATDAFGCNPIPLSAVIAVPSEIVIANNPASDITPVYCDGGGSITVAVTGGTGPNYIYYWNGPSYSTQALNKNTISNLFNPGTYTLYVEDENGCISATSSFVVPDNSNGFDASGTVNQGTCPAVNFDASIQLNINGTPILPLFITWEQWTLTNPANTGCTTNCYSWQPISGTNDLLIIGNLGPGEYRATLTDSSSSTCNTQILYFSIPDSTLEISEESLKLPSCTDLQATYSFKLTSYNPVTFYLNGNPLVLGGPILNYSNTTGKYSIKLNSSSVTMDYLITIVEQVTNGGVTTQGCEILKNITVEGYSDITYNGITNVDLNPCDLTSTYTIDTNDVTGGTPFIDGSGNPYYNYEWFGPNNFHAFGTTIPVVVGDYQLFITDSQNCKSNQIDITFAATYEDIAVTSNITNVSCDAQSDGAISINVTGGVQPLTIVWEKESQSSTGGNPNYTVIATDLLTIGNLDEGRYRLTITSNIFPCLNDQNPAYKFQAIYTVNSQNSITILEEPKLDSDLCAGNPGTLEIKVTDSSSGVIDFFYNGVFVAAEKKGNNVYLLYISNPVPSAILNVVNEFGCGEDVPIETGVGMPSFEIESDGYDLNGIVNLNEEVTFINTSIDSFYRIEWDFGDGTPISSEAEPIHTYGKYGVYTAILRGYNELDCYNEFALEIEVGSGFAVQFPEIFTPNNDGINDYFQGEMMGVLSFTFEIYDLWNNLIYTETYSGGSINSNWGWDGNLMNGDLYNARVFTYIFKGTNSEGDEFVISNQALLLR